MSPRKRFKPIKYEAIPVRELLTRMKTLSELMLDLAYSSVLFSDKSLGQWVLELEEHVDELAYQLLMTLSISVRSKTDAELSIGLFSVASSADKISDAAADIASLATTGGQIHPLLAHVFQKVEEHLIQVKIADDSQLIGRSLKELWDSEEVSVDVIAVRRDGLWTLNPPCDFVIQSGDVLFARGTGRETNQFAEIATGNPVEHTNAPPAAHDSIDELLLTMKELSEFMVSLAYASVVHYDTALAEEVGVIEDRIDSMCETFIRQVLMMGDEDIDRRWSLVRIAVATEEIADAAWEIAEIPYSGLETHSIIKQIVKEAQEVVVRLEVQEGSLLDNHTIAELALDDKYGVYIQSIRRSGHWFHRPRSTFRLRAGDVLIIDGYKEGVRRLKNDLGFNSALE